MTGAKKRTGTKTTRTAAKRTNSRNTAKRTGKHGAPRKQKATPKKRGRVKAALLLVLLLGALLFIRHEYSIAKQAAALPAPPDDGIDYEVRGIDVSVYQGDIDWRGLYDDGISFAFIKATEGSGHTDDCFSANWQGAQDAGMRAGAYHFMSWDSAGEDQAANFIATVPKFDGMLPPVVDVELYGGYLSAPPSEERLDEILTPMLKALKKEYGMAPIIYTSTSLYEHYHLNRYKNDVWVSDHTFPESLYGGKEWVFCQYSFKGDLPSVNVGRSVHVDLNVFNGSKKDFVRQYPM